MISGVVPGSAAAQAMETKSWCAWMNRWYSALASACSVLRAVQADQGFGQIVQARRQMWMTRPQGLAPDRQHLAQQGFRLAWTVAGVSWIA